MQAHNHPSPAAPISVVDAITKGTVKDLTTADVLASLKAVGIRSMDELAAHMLAKVQSEAKPGTRTPIPISLERLRQPAPDGLEAAIDHAVPQVPFFWNGVEHDPADIRRFKGKAIAYIPTRTASGDTKLHILDDMPLVRRWMESRYVNTLMTSFAPGVLTSARGGSPMPDFEGGAPATPALARSFPASVTVGEHVLTGVIGPEDPPGLWVGETLTLNPGYNYPDLTGVWLNWPWTKWNDQISYIGPSRSFCAFWDHIHFHGDALLAGAYVGGDFGGSFPFLNQIGWNDRISSFINWG